MSTIRPLTKAYTKEELLDALKRFYSLNRRAPKMSEFDSSNNLPSYTPFERHFGSLSAALKKGNIPIGYETPRQLSNEEIIESLKHFYYKNQRSPFFSELIRKNNLPNGEVIRRRFGSFNNALRIAGLPTNPANSKGERKWTSAQLIQLLQEYVRKNKFIPNQNDLTVSKIVPNANVYIRHFGSVPSALSHAGIQFSRTRFYLRLTLGRISRLCHSLSMRVREQWTETL